MIDICLTIKSIARNVSKPYYGSILTNEFNNFRYAESKWESARIYFLRASTAYSSMFNPSSTAKAVTVSELSDNASVNIKIKIFSWLFISFLVFYGWRYNSTYVVITEYIINPLILA